MFVTALIFIGILLVLILVHELGHFIMAKKSGARVEEFGFGFPPRVFGIKKGETLYSLNLLPVGGFVKIYGEDGPPPGGEKGDPKSFSSKSIWTRSIIVAAGVLMNVLLAVVLFSVGHAIGLPQALDGLPPLADVKNISIRVSDVAEGSPAQEADIHIGDIVFRVSIASEDIADVADIKDIQGFIDHHLGDEILVTVRRGDEIIEKKLVPRSNPPENEGPIGIAMLKTGEVSYPFYLAPIKGVQSTFLVASATVREFFNIISDFLSTGSFRGELSGPVGIAVMTGQVTQLGFIFLLQFVALISINLAIINILPFPALDGGRLLFFAIERIKGSPVNQKYEKLAHTVGFVVLILLMIVITFRDVGRFL